MLRKTLIGLVAAAGLLLGSTAAGLAQSLIRDAEIERTLRIISKPLIKAAGVGPVNFFIVNNNSPNAYVAGGNNIFIHTGLIRRMRSVDMLQAVIAHEIGHITGNHLSLRVGGLGDVRTATGVGMVLAVLATAAGAKGGAGIALAVQSAGQRKYLAFSRAQESAADQSGVRYIARANIDPQASLDVLNLFRGQEVLSSSRRDAYSLTHPLSAQRISDLRGYVAAYRGNNTKRDKTVDYWYARSLAKFNGFIGSPKQTLRKLSASDTGEIATLTRAIAYHRQPNAKKSMAQMARLLKMRPNDPYYRELMGQFYLENGNATTAVKYYSQAVKALPKNPQMLAGLGRAQLAQRTKPTAKRALVTLKRAYSRDPRDARMLRDLGTAYAQNGNPGMASVVTAERYAMSANFRQAAIHAKRATGLLPEGTTGWRRAADILSIAERQTRKK